MDVASRHGRSFLGCNAQFIINKAVKVRTLAVKRLENNHTAEYLPGVVRDILQEYEININDILSCATDNAANMLKMSCLLHEDQNECNKDCTSDVQEEEEEEDDQDENNSDLEIEVDVEDNVENEDDALEGFLTATRCGAHTLQLCVHDTLKVCLKVTVKKVLYLLSSYCIL